MYVINVQRSNIGIDICAYIRTNCVFANDDDDDDEEEVNRGQTRLTWDTSVDLTSSPRIGLNRLNRCCPARFGGRVVVSPSLSPFFLLPRIYFLALRLAKGVFREYLAIRNRSRLSSLERILLRKQESDR